MMIFYLYKQDSNMFHKKYAKQTLYAEIIIAIDRQTVLTFSEKLSVISQIDSKLKELINNERRRK